MREAVLASPEIKAINELNKDLYEALSKHTGQNITNPDDIFDIYGTLQAEVKIFPCVRTSILFGSNCTKVLTFNIIKQCKESASLHLPDSYPP